MFGKLAGDFYIHPFYEMVKDTWLLKMITQLPVSARLMKIVGVTHSVADNAQKNTLAYYCIQHKNFGWLLKAQMLNPQTKPFVSMYYWIGHDPAVTRALLKVE